MDYDDEDAARQEAQQLEDMIRGRRGIVLEAVEREWRAEMLKTVEEEGERLCDEAYEGFSTRGRGAIFVSTAAPGAGFLSVHRTALVRPTKCMSSRIYARGSLFVERVFGSVAEPYEAWILFELCQALLQLCAVCSVSLYRSSVVSYDVHTVK